jgi:hypothetical protein
MWNYPLYDQRTFNQKIDQVGRYAKKNMKQGQKYWYINSWGEITDEIWYNTEYDKIKKDFGNIFIKKRDAINAKKEMCNVLKRYNKKR